MTRVLVTGGTGFIGRHSVPALVRSGHEVHVVSRSGRGVPDGVRSHRADLLDPGQTAALLDSVRPTHLLHLAWDVTPGRYLGSPENLRWTVAGLRLLREFARHGERAVLAGTCFEYDLRHGLCSESETPLAPATLYGNCKHSLQVMADSVGREEGLSVAWGRIFFVYGPAEYPSRLVASVARALLAGEPAPVSHGRQVRDYMHSADVGEAFAALVDSEVDGPVNVASGDGTEVAELVAAIGAAAGRPDLIRLGERPSPPDEPPTIVADARRLREEVGWAPARSLESGIADTVGWWRRELAAA